MIIVVGAGTAGLSLAIAAAAAGASVQLIEKTNRIGGTLHLSNGMFSAGGTRRQRERGIEDSPTAHFEDVIRISKNTVHRELVRLYCDLAPGMVDWLDDEGFEFRPDCPMILYGHEPYRVPRTYWGIDDGQSILKVLARLAAPHLESGRIKVAFERAAERLMVEDDRVVGVVAGGREWRGSAVVLTTGGYGRNPEMFARFTGGRRLVSYAAESSTGDGLRIGEEAGAAIAGDQYFLPSFGGLENPDQPGTVYLPVPDSYNQGARLIPQYRQPWEVWVNARGERFIREDDPSVDVRERALLKQPDMRFWVVFDDAVLEQSPPLYSQWPADDIRALARGGKLVQQAETLGALAPKMEVPDFRRVSDD
jgi:predicted oxidoreductase